MSDNIRLDRIRALRKSLKAPQRASLADIADELLEIFEETETRLRFLEQANEETD